MGIRRMDARPGMWGLFPWLVAASGFLISYFAYAPGIMTPDGTGQFHQALTRHYNDVHPPVMAWLWTQTNAVVPGPEGFFLVLLTLYWVGFLLLIRNLLRRSMARAIIASILPFSPIFFSVAGMIWQDVLMFDCLLVATGIILGRAPGESGRFPVLAGAIGAVLLVLACLARWNAFPAVIPLVVLAIWPQPAARAPLRRLIYRLVLCLPVVLLVWAGSAAVLQARVVHAERTGFANMLPMWDLIGMSHRLNRNLLPGSWTEQQSRQITQSCFTPIDDNNLAGSNGSCWWIHQHIVKDGDWKLTTLFPLWAQTIARHPGAYLALRLRYARTLFWPNAIFMFNADDGIGPFDHESSRVFELEKSVMNFLKSTPGVYFLVTVGFWLVASAALTLGFALALSRGRTSCYTSFLLSLSGAATVWPLVIIGPDGQLRYAYWAIGTACMALLYWRLERSAPQPSVETSPAATVAELESVR